jgi:hypothetical protein
MTSKPLLSQQREQRGNHNIGTEEFGRPSGGVPISQVHSFYPPRSVINPSSVDNPFGSEEYVGPNSSLFSNPHNVNQPIPGSLRIPPGARYDPVDPFDYPQEQPEEFIGFD